MLGTSLTSSMICAELIERKLQEAALKERMLLDSFLILGTVEEIQDQLEKKLLEIDEAELYNNDGKLPLLRRQVLALLAKLRQEEKHMDEYMAKYRKLVHEKKALLSRTRTKKPIYLRGLPPNERRLAKS